MPPYDLCQAASVVQNGTRRWKNDPNSKHYVAEAKYRSLKCGVGSVQKGDIKDFRNMEIKGSNLISYALQGGSKSQCISKCRNSNSCKAISYEKRTKSCWLKMQTLPLIHSPGTDSVKFLK